MNSGVSFWEAIQPWLIGVGIVFPSVSALCIAILLVFVFGRPRLWIKAALIVAWFGIVVSVIGALAMVAPNAAREQLLRLTADRLHHNGLDTFTVAHFVAEWKHLALASGIAGVVALVLLNSKVRAALRRQLLPEDACPNCGYPLIGLAPGGVCPECGNSTENE